MAPLDSFLPSHISCANASQSSSSVSSLHFLALPQFVRHLTSSTPERLCHSNWLPTLLTTESGTATGTFDFITGFSSGDSIQFDNISSLKLVLSGTTGTSVTAGALGLTASLSNWNGENSQTGTLLSANHSGRRHEPIPLRPRHQPDIQRCRITVKLRRLTQGLAPKHPKSWNTF